VAAANLKKMDKDCSPHARVTREPTRTQGGPKSKPLPNYQKMVLKPASEIRFIRQNKVFCNIIR